MNFTPAVQNCPYPVLVTVKKGLALRKFGRLEEEDRRALREALRVILDE